MFLAAGVKPENLEETHEDPGLRMEQGSSSCKTATLPAVPMCHPLMFLINNVSMPKSGQPLCNFLSSSNWCYGFVL